MTLSFMFKLYMINIFSSLLINSGIAYSNSVRPFATQVLRSVPKAIWVSETMKPQLRMFLGEPINTRTTVKDPKTCDKKDQNPCDKRSEKKIRTPVTSSGCYIPTEEIPVVRDGLRSVNGPDIFDQFGLAVTQTPSAQGNHV